MAATYEPLRDAEDPGHAPPVCIALENRLDGTASETESSDTSTAISRQLYISHFLSTWNIRGFEFGAVLFLATIFPGTLLPMSMYALVRAASAIFLSSLVGRYIDHGDRLEVVRLSIGKLFRSNPHLSWQGRLSMGELCS